MDQADQIGARRQIAIAYGCPTSLQRRLHCTNLPDDLGGGCVGFGPAQFSELDLAEVKAGLANLRDRSVQLLWGDFNNGFHEAKRQRFERLFSMAQTIVLRGVCHSVEKDARDETCAAFVGSEYLVSADPNAGKQTF